MATSRAIASACEAIVRLLRARHDPGEFPGAALTFQVFGSGDFTRAMDAGVSLWLYQVIETPLARRLPSPPPPGGPPSSLPVRLELQVVLTAWGKTVARQLEIAGWMMRVLQEEPIITAPLLNAHHAGVFGADESIGIALAPVPADALLGAWRSVTDRPYQLSVLYVVRPIEIASATHH